MSLTRGQIGPAGATSSGFAGPVEINQASDRSPDAVGLIESQLAGAAPRAAPAGAEGRDISSRFWTINGDFLGLQPTGVARYAREVTLALDALVVECHPLARNVQFEVVAPREGREALPLKAIPVRVVPEFDKPRLPQVWVQLQLPRHVRGGLLSFCNLAPVSVRRQIVCIHDLHTRIMPTSYGPFFRWAHRIILPLLGRRSAYITTVSHFSRRHLVEFGIASPGKIAVTYNGSDHALRWDAARSNASLPAAGRPYVLCLGQNQKYKNVELLVRLAGLLDGMGLDLWMAGDVDISRHSSLRPGNLHLLGRIGDDALKKAFSDALCFLFPSRIEGFGLPAVEAMAAGCPVVASMAPCLPEICGNAALYASPDDPHAWAGEIWRLRDDPALRQRLIGRGIAQARRYTWRGVAEIYLELIARVDATTSARETIPEKVP